MLTLDEVKHVADLARISLSDQEAEKYQDQLGKILAYMEKLKEINTLGVATADGGTIDLENVWREDHEKLETRNQKPENLIAIAPEVESGQVKVRSVFN